ncbi:MAG: hypothetical protein ACKOPS_23395 [Cyanobium sp.]
MLVADAVALQERLGSGNSLRQMLAGDQCAIGRQERRGLQGGGWGLEPPADLGAKVIHGYFVMGHLGKP